MTVKELREKLEQEERDGRGDFTAVYTDYTYGEIEVNGVGKYIPFGFEGEKNWVNLQGGNSPD